MITQTECGAAVFITKLTKIENGSIGLFLLLNNDNTPSCFALMYEQGGDRNGFLDGAEHDAEQLNWWEPDAIFAAINEVRLLRNDKIMEDMEWFEEWANAAIETIEKTAPIESN